MLGIRGWLYVKIMWPNLNLTRGFGDLEYKQNKNLKPEEQMITANSDIKVVDFIENLLLIIKEKYKKLINFF